MCTVSGKRGMKCVTFYGAESNYQLKIIHSPSLPFYKGAVMRQPVITGRVDI